MWAPPRTCCIGPRNIDPPGSIPGRSSRTSHVVWWGKRQAKDCYLPSSPQKQSNSILQAPRSPAWHLILFASILPSVELGFFLPCCPWMGSGSLNAPDLKKAPDDPAPNGRLSRTKPVAGSPTATFAAHGWPRSCRSHRDQTAHRASAT